ncbi:MULTISPECIES: DUF2515 domain-containing protein [Bacillaceae]|uniref:DUF2515 domain-containing protein n=1 Tax=Bacillaceae TaxID=186817 RepID=UPI000C772F12|nr:MULTISPECIES: DUF2515 domain-containing protein [Bacillaceae]PLR66178.1 DUF2515 domain-containing protein [Bacillus sp. UMB0893]QNG61895.1 DUF2515 domain-containing protein [Bacillus sp. PAMC26568]
MAIGRFKRKKITIKSYLEIKEELKRKRKNKPSTFSELKLSKEERKLINYIKEMTNKLNVNNVIRTQAYLDFFLQHPEIHWALLGHMVSRNGGWHMTDLKGDLLQRLLSEKEQQNFFLFLERGNWLIFQDVYPQFLLYKQSLKINKNLFYLLPYVDVSVFMETIWNYFWEHGDCYLLAIATVINEQSYLEKKVIQNHHFKKTVLNTIGFRLYDFLHFNHIIFPYYKKEKAEKPNLLGETLQHFDSLHERIMLGKRLYSLLFHQESVLQGVLLWANKHPHTGSRKDYWDHLFHHVSESLPGSIYRRRTKQCQLKKGALRIYSPPLQFAWKNVDHSEAEKGDWFDDWRIIDYLMEEEKYAGGEIYDVYCKTIEKIELAIIAKKAIFLRRE